MPHVIGEPCIGVKDASCDAVCPVSAISAEGLLPTEWRRDTTQNDQAFQALSMTKKK
ncbi:hypothetical protein KX928_23845 [Roseobacter sp. YSTF-M11]|uniref:Ferredoxin n=1 Tax=Roseobacter insulae TaxID=2859783 RepID=A0A9X1K311_9RHOB|nr:hypothetical protein [Roseobacter insulae]MBW4710834.1 hypothetical protein [Roseobacter insulae]